MSDCGVADASLAATFWPVKLRASIGSGPRCDQGRVVLSLAPLDESIAQKDTD